MKKITAIILMISLILAFAGCGKKKGQQEQNGDESASGGVYSKSRYNELAIYSYRPDSFCPVTSVNDANLQMLNIVYEGLVELDETLIPQPYLAESWSVSEDGCEWYVNLRAGVKWHNGDSFTARDVVYTVNQIQANPQSLYVYNISHISEIEAQGSNTVIFKLTEPKANFISLLYFPVIKYDEEDINSEEFRPIGTGPYKFEDRNEGNICYLVRNDEWWNGKATMDEVSIKLLPDRETPVYAFASGDIDMTVINDSGLMSAVPSETTVTKQIATPIYSFIGINHNNSVLGMPEVRAAISVTLDRNKIIDEVMTKNAVPANAPIREEWFVNAGQKYDFTQNTKLAHDKLIENGWQMSETEYQKKVEDKEHKLKFDILINEENAIRNYMAQAIEKNLEEFGMDVTVTKVPYSTYLERINGGQYDTFIGSYLMSADLNMEQMFASNIAVGFSDDIITASMQEMKKGVYNDETVGAYQKFINRFNETNPVIGLMFENRLMLYNDTVNGEGTPSYFDVYDGLEQLYVERAEGS